MPVQVQRHVALPPNLAATASAPLISEPLGIPSFDFRLTSLRHAVGQAGLQPRLLPRAIPAIHPATEDGPGVSCCRAAGRALGRYAGFKIASMVRWEPGARGSREAELMANFSLAPVPAGVLEGYRALSVFLGVQDRNWTLVDMHGYPPLKVWRGYISFHTQARLSRHDFSWS